MNQESERLDDGEVGYWLWRGLLFRIYCKFETAAYLAIFFAVVAVTILLFPLWVLFVIATRIISKNKKREVMF